MTFHRNATVLIALFALLTVASCMRIEGTAPAGRALQATELAQIVPGQSFQYLGERNGTVLSGLMTFNENRNLFVETYSGIPEGGTWRQDGQNICITLVALLRGTEECAQVFEQQDGYRFAGFHIQPVETP